MGSNLQSGGHRRRLRPIDLARAHGLSTQAVRNYEEAGILPPAARTPHGYRTYTPLHSQALGTFLALLPGHGHSTATAIMRAVHEDAVEEAFRHIDESHAQLLDDRRTLRAVETALRDLGADGERVPGGLLPAAPRGAADRSRPAAPSRADARPSAGARSGVAAEAGSASGADARPAAGPRDTFVGALAAQLGIRPATLRTWERAGLVRPRRDPRTGYRVYDADAVRDARLAHQLRRGGYLLEQIAPLIAQVRSAGGLEPLRTALDDWHARLSARARAMLTGAAELDAYLRERDAHLRGREAHLR
ncbi:TioE family transcriptional regulator [Streptomyces roseicoloratus]|uniref:TioE family transcriptional regulator n=1 Tax=Streptomyces roseicoloratus TaxID=2508722 RepID=A0ABY9S167_9ACTN|nr:TioE family transcriptional regulator [Streptomyces roseicoloratus]WMX48035.1 TioE family transcriptional regulator [Streptomyces roseicoloratus]